MQVYKGNSAYVFAFVINYSGCFFSGDVCTEVDNVGDHIYILVFCTLNSFEIKTFVQRIEYQTFKMPDNTEDNIVLLNKNCVKKILDLFYAGFPCIKKAP